MARNLDILIVEDNRTNLMFIEMLVRQIPNCNALTYSSPVDLLRDLDSVDFELALLDYQMPGMNGVDLISEIRSVERLSDRPIVMITADRDAATRMSAIRAGAIDFLEKPIEPVEFKTRLGNLLRLCEAQKQLADRAEWLRGEVEKATRELRRREEEIISRLTLAAGYKDRETAGHTFRMARYSALLAGELGFDAESCRDIQLAAPMHDIGKVGIRDAVLLKNDGLDDDERQHMNEHAAIGAAILDGSDCGLLRLASEIAVSHHERWDGKGYPSGLSGTGIPLVGRIAAVADVFDALTSERPYKDAWTTDRAFAYLREQAGIQFDPGCVAAFERIRPKIEEIRLRHRDNGSRRLSAA